jgi:hypothetical protein
MVLSPVGLRPERDCADDVHAVVRCLQAEGVGATVA